MDDLTLDIKKSAGVIKAIVKAVKMTPRNGVKRIRLKTSAVKAILKERGYQPGITVHANNIGILDNSESSAHFNLETTWIFKDLDVPTPSVEPQPDPPESTPLKFEEKKMIKYCLCKQKITDPCLCKRSGTKQTRTKQAGTNKKNSKAKS